MSDWRLPGYTEIETLGVGGFGRVVLAKHQRSGVLVAIKYLHARYLTNPQVVDGFRREASMLAAVPSPHVVRVFDFVLQPDGAALVMEAVPGVSLKAILAADGSLAPESALAVLKGSLLGLAAAHGVGVVHRDYKPDNVLVNDRGESKLVDFGLAVLDGQLGLSAGSPAYMAPEQWAGQPGTPATDVYAATCVFFQCVTGEKPFAAATSAEFKTLHEFAPPPLHAVPEQLRGLVSRGMAKDPSQRPATAGAFVAELQAVAAATYGQDWERVGWQRLAARASALLALSPLALLATSATAAAPVVGTGAVGAGAAGTATAAGTAGIGATASGGLLATATAKVAAAALAVVAVGAGGVVVYNAVAEDDPAPVAQPRIEPLYAFTTSDGFGVGNGTKVVGATSSDGASTLPVFTDDHRYAFVWNTTTGVVAIDTRSGDEQRVPCGGCTTVVPAGGSKVAWIGDSGTDDPGVVVTDLAGREQTRTVQFQQELEPPASDPSVQVGPPGLIAGGGGTLLLGYPANPAGFSAKSLYLVDIDDGAVRRVASDEAIVNSYAEFSRDGSKIAFASGARSEACSGDVQVAVIDVASGRSRREPSVESAQPVPNEGRGVTHAWWIGDQLHARYERTLCKPDGSTQSQVPPTVYRLADGRWQPLSGVPSWRPLGPRRSVSLAGFDPSNGTGTLVVDLDGKRTEVQQNVLGVSTPSW